MFNWFKKNTINIELENMYELLKNYDITYIETSAFTTVYTFSNSFVMIFNEQYDSLNVKNKVDNVNLFTQHMNKRTLLEFKKKFVEKANNYRNSVAIHNQNFNFAQIDYSFNDDIFYWKLAQALQTNNTISSRYIASALWENGRYNEDGQTFKEAVLKGLFELMKGYYGENRLLEKIVEVGGNESKN